MKMSVNSRGISRRGRSAFTLLEVVLALFLTILLLSGVFAFYDTVLRSREEGGRATREAKMFRVILAGIAEEVRHATSVVPGDGVGFRGDRHKLTIVCLGLPEKYAFDEYDLLVDKPPPGQLDLRRVSYELIWDEELEDDEGVPICHGLWRTEQRTFDPNPSFVIQDDEAAGFVPEDGEEEGEDLTPHAEGELFAPEIKYVEFAYFDGAQWRDRWQFAGDSDESGEGEFADPGTDAEGLDDLSALTSGASGLGGASDQAGGYALPQAVRITIGRVRVDPEEDDLSLSEFQEREENPAEQGYHADRFTIVVPLLQADQTLLSSRKYGVSDGMSRQEGGPQ